MDLHSEMLPHCREREAKTAQILAGMAVQIAEVHKAVVGNGDTENSLVAQINRHIAYWRIFAIIGGVLAALGTIIGTIATAATLIK